MPDPAVRRQVVASVVGKLETALPFGPSDAPPTVRPAWIEGMSERFGFSVPQAAFTSHVASLGGLFTTRQAELWLAGNWTEWCADWEPGLARRARVRFLQPLFCPAGQRSAVARAFSLSDDRIFTHISNRSAYAVLEHPNSKYRRLPRLPGILQRLTAYDYVLEHSSLRWYALTRAKVDLMKQLGVSRPDLPQRTYQSRYDETPATPGYAVGAVLRRTLSDRHLARLAGRLRVRRRAVPAAQPLSAYRRQLRLPVPGPARARPPRVGRSADHAWNRVSCLGAFPARRVGEPADVA